MAVSSGLRELGSLVALPFQGEDWAKKLIIGAGLVLLSFIIPVIPLIFLYGYAIRLTLQAVAGDELHLPEWVEWDKLASYGVRALAVGLIFSLPAMIVFMGAFGLYFVSTLAMAGSGYGEPSGWSVFFTLLSFGVLMLSMPVGSVLMLGAAIVSPPALVHFAVRDKFISAFYFREWWPILTGNKLGYFVAWVFIMGLAGLVYWVVFLLGYSFFLCWLLPLIVAPLGYYLTVVAFALFGTCYREGMIARYE
jgi:hypothetical protein